jgi:phosphinothricin acetyltransferase
MIFIRSINFTLTKPARIVPAMLLRPDRPKPFLARTIGAVMAGISSPRFAAARRRSALAGLDARQLADIGLAFVDGDYVPCRPDAVTPTVRDSRDDDIERIAGIYAHHILHGSASFEEVPPPDEELARRRADVVRDGLPYLVATIGDTVAGYAYASRYRTRSAYRYAVEDSVYVAEGMHRRGIGRALLAALIARCEAGPWRQMIAVIGNSGNAPSIGLHRRLGFAHAGTLHAVGWKFGAWTDTVLMQRSLNGGDRCPPTP